MELNSEDIAFEFFPFLRVYKNGRMERHILTSRVPPGIDPLTGAQSKDVVINSDINLSARIFIPNIEIIPKRLPLLVHFHGGGFCTGSAFCPITKYFFSNFACLAQMVVLSVDYRLAPEHPLPIAYDDSWDALKWVATHAHGHGTEAWLNEYVDFGRVFIGGESSGANIAHYVTLQASLVGLDDDFKIVGLSLVHPYFGATGLDKLYQYLCPTSSGTYGDPRLNPGMDPRLGSLACDKVLVCVAEKDMLKGSGLDYYRALKRSGFRGKVELVESEGEGHCFHLLNSNDDNNIPFLSKLVSFVLEDC